jgi:ABC-type Na+ efflux pump, permease component
MYPVFKREIRSYFLTPLGYVFISIFLLVGGVFFMIFNLFSMSSDLGTMFGNLNYLFMFIVPLLTMRLFGEERRTKTDQMLLTSPVSLGAIVVGKYFAACAVLLVSLLLASGYVIIIVLFSTPYYGLIASNYLGLLFIGGSYIAIGVLMSALSENQLSAAVLTFGVNLLMQLLEFIWPQLSVPQLPWLPKVFSVLSLHTRYASFAAGMISMADLIYFASFIGICLFLTVRTMDQRRWSK